MNSGGLTYEPSLSAHAEGLSAQGETLPASEASAGIRERVDHGKDWPLVFAFFTPVVAAYGGIAFGLYKATGAIF
jgi:hypothetical protein